MRLIFILVLVILIPFCLLAQKRTYQLSEKIDPSLVRADRIVVKFKAGKNPQTTQIPQQTNFKVSAFESVKRISKNQRGSSVLDGIYYLQLTPDQNPIKTCNALLQNNEVEYAEVLVYEQLFHTPNDPQANPTSGNQNYLSVIKAYEAWDITTGDPNILIGINDTGMDVDHEDLINKYYHNPGEVIDGLDNDNNGYIDDILGYDFADNDNDPNADTEVNSTLNHGTHVGGVAGAETNNGIGVASIGYDCAIVPLKGFTTNGTFSTGVWEGVIYAADNGYDVINLSWGSTFYSQYYQDIINYCVLEKDMVVVAAAGNENADLDYYPASYEHVLSVAASTLSDTKWSTGTYGDHVDIMAPGVTIQSTQKDDTYNSDSGSSHASPMVAGVAGLVKSVFPSYNARQIMEQIRVTSDDISEVSGNEVYQYKLGKGRLNAFRAVTETDAKSIRINNVQFDNGYGSYAFYGDTVNLSFEIINYLKKVEDATISVESDSPYATILEDSFEPGLMQPMQSIDVTSFKVIVDENTPPNTKINLRFFMKDGSYTDFQNISLFTSPDFLNMESPNTSLTVAGNGDLGLTSNYTSGSGFSFQDELIGTFHGLLLGNSDANLYDNVPRIFSPNVANDGDFTGTKGIKFYEHSTAGNIAYSEFETFDGDFLIEQTAVSGEEDFVVVEYRIVNRSGGDLNDFKIGFFSDLDLPDGGNSCSWSVSDEALLFTDETGSLQGALASITPSPEYVALNMQANNGHSRDIGDTFNDTQKFNFLNSSNVSNAGELAGGNDVAGLLKTSLSNFTNNSEFKIAFILTLGESGAMISSNLTAARSTYEDFKNNPQVSETYFSCLGGEVTLNPEGTQFDFFEDPLGELFIANSETLLVDNITKDTAIYFQNLDAGYPSRLSKISIKILEDIALFEPSTDTLYLDHPTLNAITFQDQSYEATSWTWNFGNGEQSTTQNPTINFQSIGEYEVSLGVESALGCSDEVTQTIVVANRPDSPTIDDFSICSGESIELTHPSDEYAIFDNQGNRVLKGSNVDLGPFEEDSTLLVANRINGFESIPQQVLVTVDQVVASYQIFPDTTSTETAALFRFTGNNGNLIEWRLDGKLESTSSEFTFPISSDLELELTTSNDECSDVLTESISFITSPTPSQSDLQACLGGSLTITPQNGTYFAFYEDASLTQLIHKGKQLHIDEVSESFSIHVVGLDNILPGNSIMVSVEAVDFNTSIQANPPTLNLADNSTAQFSVTNMTTARWFLNGQLIETALSPILFFNEPGIYEIKVEGVNSIGCSFTETIQYEVIGLVTGIDDTSLFTVFPNPSSGQFSIETVEQIQSISVYDISGKLVLDNVEISHNNIELNLGNGVYFLKIATKETTTLKKISIR